jgi:hypothetical protein
VDHPDAFHGRYQLECIGCGARSEWFCVSRTSGDLEIESEFFVD